MKPIVVSIFALIALEACSSNTVQNASNIGDGHSGKTQQREYALALPEKHAAIAVAKVLESGGNAVDEAVTAGFTLAVTFPTAGNIGGGGFMLADFNGESHFLDYRETAPAAASRDMFIAQDGSVNPRSSLIGARASGVPGTVAGLWEAHQKLGSKPWADLIAPAIELAENGFEVHPKTAKDVSELDDWFAGEVNFMEHFGNMQHGGIFKQPDLANTLKRIAKHGPKDFYQGKTAELLVAQMKKNDGLITAKDLSNYTAVWRQPLVANWQGYEVISAPPPSSGGFAVIHLLKMKEHLQNQFDGTKHNSTKYVHLIAEMEKRVFADRAEYFGDPDFVAIPMQELMDEDYIKARAGLVNTSAISETENVKPGIDSPNTTHYSIVDQWGNAVSNTYTINWSYGNGVVVEGAGFLLNNEMDDFSTKPGVPNVYGVVGGVSNEIQPNKRMLSSMSPTIVRKDGKVHTVVGGMGGSTIFTSVFQVITNLIDFDMSAQDAVDAVRFHHQLLPKDLVTMSQSEELTQKVQKELKSMGYKVEPHGFEFGNMQLVTLKDGKLSAASDSRFIGKSIVGVANDD